MAAKGAITEGGVNSAIAAVSAALGGLEGVASAGLGEILSLAGVNPLQLVIGAFSGRPKMQATFDAVSLVNDANPALKLLGLAAGALYNQGIPLSSPAADRIFGKAFAEAVKLETAARFPNAPTAPGNLKLSAETLQNALYEAANPGHGLATIQALDQPSIVSRFNPPSSVTTAPGQPGGGGVVPSAPPAPPHVVTNPGQATLPGVSLTPTGPGTILGPISMFPTAARGGLELIGSTLGSEFGIPGKAVGAAIGYEVGQELFPPAPSGGVPVVGQQSSYSNPPPSYTGPLIGQQTPPPPPSYQPPAVVQPAFQYNPMTPTTPRAPTQELAPLVGQDYCPECDPNGNYQRMLGDQERELEEHIQTEERQLQDVTQRQQRLGQRVSEQQQQLQQFGQQESRPRSPQQIRQELQQKQQLLQQIQNELEELSNQPESPTARRQSPSPQGGQPPLEVHPSEHMPPVVNQPSQPNQLPTSGEQPVTFCVGCASQNDAFRFLNGEPSQCSVIPNSGDAYGA